MRNDMAQLFIVSGPSSSTRKPITFASLISRTQARSISSLIEPKDPI